jgi:hypothetical protein
VKPVSGLMQEKSRKSEKKPPEPEKPANGKERLFCRSAEKLQKAAFSGNSGVR